VPSSFAPTTVTLLTHDSFALTEQLLTDFEKRSGITVKVVTGGDAGELVNKAALTAGNPEGDVLFGVDNTLLSRALEAGVFDPYVSPLAVGVPDELEAATDGAVTPVDYGDVCINVDDAWFADDNGDDGFALLEDSGSLPPSRIGGIVTAALVGPRGAVAAIGALGLIATLTTLIAIIFSVFAIIALVQAYQYKEYRIPFVGGISDKVAGMFGGAAGK